MAVDPSVIDSVTSSNFKILGEQVASNIAAGQQRLQIMAEKSLAVSLQAMDQDMVSVAQGLGLQAAEGGGLASQIASLAAAVASIQSLIKGGQTTPPVTG